MTLEKPEHKQMLLELMRASSFSGTVLPLAYELLLALQAAEIKTQLADSTETGP